MSTIEDFVALFASLWNVHEKDRAYSTPLQVDIKNSTVSITSPRDDELDWFVNVRDACLMMTSKLPAKVLETRGMLCEIINGLVNGARYPASHIVAALLLDTPLTRDRVTLCAMKVCIKRPSLSLYERHERHYILLAVQTESSNKSVLKCTRIKLTDNGIEVEIVDGITGVKDIRAILLSDYGIGVGYGEKVMVTPLYHNIISKEQEGI